MVAYFNHKKGNNTVTAVITGTMEYSIGFYLQAGGIYSTCECPYDGVFNKLNF